MLRGLVFRQLFIVGDVCLAGLIALVAMMAFMKAMTDKSNAEVAEATPLEAQGVGEIFLAAAPREEYNAIMKSGLFGPAAAKTQDFKEPEPPKPDPPKEETETKLPLRLKGTVLAGTGDERATAVIEVREGATTENTYYVGQEVLDRVILKEVRHREVILENRRTNTLEVLRKTEEDDAIRVAAQRNSRVPSRRPATPSTANVIELNKRQLQTELMDSYADIAAKVDVREYRDASGNVKGLTASNVSQIPLAQKLGLKDDDVLTHLNNEPVDSVEKVADILNKYRNATHFRIGILRGGRPQYITYKLD